MLVFIDESYDQDSKGVWHYALAGFGINEFRYRALEAAIYQLRLDTFDMRTNYVGETWREVLGSKIISETNPALIELKASELLKASSLRRFGGSDSPHYQVVSKALSATAGLPWQGRRSALEPEPSERYKRCLQRVPTGIHTLD